MLPSGSELWCFGGWTGGNAVVNDGSKINRKIPTDSGRRIEDKRFFIKTP